MDIEQRTIRKIGLRLMPLLLASGVMSLLDRINVSFAASGMIRDLGFTATVYGFGAGLLFVGYVLLEVPSNIMLTKFGPNRWLFRIMVTWGILAGATAFVTGANSFYVMRLLLGAAEAGLFPGVIYVLTLWFPSAIRARFIAIFFMALPLTGVLAGVISGPLLDLEGNAGLHGWQWLFLIEAAPAVILAFLILFFLPTSPDKAKFLDADELAWLKGRLDKDKRSGGPGHQSILQALTNWRVLTLALLAFCPASMNYGLSFFLPLIIKGFGHTNVQTGFIAAIPFVFGSLACFFWGRHSDKVHERKFHVIASLSLAGAGFALSTVFATPSVQLVMIILAAIGLYSYTPPFWAMMTEYISNAGPVGTAAAIAAVNGLSNIGGFVSPTIFGYLKDHTGSYTGGILYLAALGALGVTWALVFSYSTRRTTIAQPA